MNGLYAGTFDPPTLGHLDLILRASSFCNELIIAVTDGNKLPFFTLAERLLFLKKMTQGLEDVKVIEFSGLVIECAREHDVDCLIRGLRSNADFEHEYQMAAANRQMSGIETIFLAATPALCHLSSSLVREIGALGHRLKGFVPDEIEARVFERLSESH